MRAPIDPEVGLSAGQDGTQRALIQAGLLGAGCMVGFVAAWWVTGLDWDFPGDLRAARDLGIVSRTILAGYPKSRDIVTYLAVLGLPVLAALVLWLPWAWRNRAPLRRDALRADEEQPPSRDRLWVLCLAAVALIWVILPFNRLYLYWEQFTDQVGPWMFLGEEGSVLAWVQSIFNGGVQGRDFYCLYGPMLIYPLTWLMRIFGESVLVSRGYTYALNLLSGAILVMFLWSVIRRRWIFVFSALFLLMAFWPPLHVLSPNTTYLRVGLGLLTLLLLHHHRRTGRNAYLVAAGAVLGQGFLFSQEVALCALLAALAVMAWEDLPRRAWGKFRRTLLWFLGACLASMAPLLLYFFAKGALGPLLADLYGYPRLVMLGYGGLPFPTFRDFLAQPLGTGFFENYWIILVYVFTAIRLAPALFVGRRDQRTLVQLSLLVFGVILYRSALGRTDLSKAFFVSPPAFLLLFVQLDRAVATWRRGGDRVVSMTSLAGAGLILWVLAVMPFTNVIWSRVLKDLKREVAQVGNKWDYPRTGREVPGLARSSGQFSRDLGAWAIDVRNFLDEYTARGEYVYFFPNEAAAYFVFERRMPTRYALAYFAATKGQRRELVADLERNKPRFVVVSRSTWRIDNIPESVQVPEVVEYLRRAYGVFERRGAVIILKRREG